MAEPNGVGETRARRTKSRSARKSAGSNASDSEASSPALGSAAPLLAAAAAIAIAYGVTRLLRRRPRRPPLLQLPQLVPARPERPSLFGSMLRAALVSAAGALANRFVTRLGLEALDADAAPTRQPSTP